MTNLLASLGMDDVKSDPNDLADGRYPGVIFKSEAVVKPSDNTLSHVITYMVTGDGPDKGAQKAEWFTLGSDVQKDEAGNVTGFTPSMSEAQKPWYKKRLVDLGIAEERITSFDFNELVGRNVVFGIKTNGQYKNINFVERAPGEANVTELPSGPVVAGPTPDQF